MAVFDLIAGSYDSWYESKLGSFVDMVETKLAFDLFDVKEGMSVLDIGCGTGNFSSKLARKGCRVSGIDISDNMLEIARRKAESEKLDIAFRNMDLYKLDFPDECFDAAFSMATFEFVREPEQALNEIFRVVKKGGSILIGTIHRNSSWGELYMGEELQRNSVFKYAHFKTIKELRSLKSRNLVSSGECLFLPPDIGEEDITMEKEQEFSCIEQDRGGYICALWRK